MTTQETRTVELYNICRAGRAVANGFLVRVVKDGRTAFVKFDRDEAGARRYAAEGGRLYHVVWARDDNGTRGVHCHGPFTHEEACMVLRKFRDALWARLAEPSWGDVAERLPASE